MNFLLYHGFQREVLEGRGETELGPASALSADVAGTAALVAVLRARGRTVLHHVANLVAVVAGILFLATVSSDMTGAVTLVATILLLTTLACKVAKPVAFVTL